MKGLVLVHGKRGTLQAEYPYTHVEEVRKLKTGMVLTVWIY